MLILISGCTQPISKEESIVSYGYGKLVKAMINRNMTNTYVITDFSVGYFNETMLLGIGVDKNGYD